MNNSFETCCAFTLLQEGGFCNVQGDPGGATNHGVTIGELGAVLGHPATLQDIQNLTTEQAEAIYKPNYWDTLNGDLLPSGVNLVVFDFGVTAGWKKSAELLQGALDVNIDGQIGPVTCKALATYPAKALVNLLTYSHLTYYQSLPGWNQFGKGWQARALRCQVMALSMCRD